MFLFIYYNSNLQCILLGFYEKHHQEVKHYKVEGKGQVVFSICMNKKFGGDHITTPN